jgi:hypothetical protein
MNDLICVIYLYIYIGGPGMQSFGLGSLAAFIHSRNMIASSHALFPALH